MHWPVLNLKRVQMTAHCIGNHCQLGGTKSLDKKELTVQTVHQLKAESGEVMQSPESDHIS